MGLDKNAIVELNAHKTDNATQLSYTKNTLQPDVKKNKCMVSLIADDGKQEDNTMLVPILKDKGVKGCFAIPITYALNWWKDNIPTALALQNDFGYEFCSHTYNHLNLTTLTEAEIESELALSKAWLVDNGFKGNTFVYPQGGHNELARKLVRKYFDCGITTIDNNGINESILRTFNIARVGLGSYPNTTYVGDKTGFPSDGSTLEYAKARVDYALANNQWLVFMLHPSNTVTEQWQVVKDTIDYIKSLNIEIVTPSEALKTVANVIDVGDYNYVNTTNKYLVVGSNGEIRSSYIPNNSNHVFNTAQGLSGLTSYNPSNLSIENSATSRTGKTSLKLTRLTSLTSHALINNYNIDNYKGKVVTCGAWVMCPSANVGDFKVGIQDGITNTLSTLAVPRDAKWYFVTATQLISAVATTIQPNIGRVSDNAVAGDIMYVDAVFVVLGTEIPREVYNYAEGTTGYNDNYAFICTSPTEWQKRPLKNENGITTKRPANPIVGYQWFDTTLSKPIWCKTIALVDANGIITTPAVWVDASGATV